MRRGPRQRGVAAIEFALILPMFCVLVFGVIDYGYYFFVDLAATNAVREGARTATTYTTCGGSSAGTTAVTTYLSNIGLGSLSASPSCPCTTVTGGTQYACTLTVTVPQLSGFSLVPVPTSVTTAATMRGP